MAEFDPYLEWLQIAPAGRAATHYELLGLPSFCDEPQRAHSAASERIALVRRYQAGKYGEVSIRLMGEIAQALTCLTDPTLKTAYDGQLRGAATVVEAPPEGPPQALPATQTVPQPAPASKTPVFDPYLVWLGMSPDAPRDHYTLLGLCQFEPDLQVIREAAIDTIGYLQMELDGEHSREAARLIQQVNEARQCLLAPRTKKAYDENLREPVRVPTGAEPRQTRSELADDRKNLPRVLVALAIVAATIIVVGSWLGSSGNGPAPDLKAPLHVASAGMAQSAERSTANSLQGPAADDEPPTALPDPDQTTPADPTSQLAPSPSETLGAVAAGANANPFNVQKLNPAPTDPPAENPLTMAPPTTTEPLRTWSLVNATFEAEFVNLDGGYVELRRRDGGTFRVRLRDLSQADGAFVVEQMRSRPATAMPPGEAPLMAGPPAAPIPTRSTASRTGTVPIVDIRSLRTWTRRGGSNFEARFIFLGCAEERRDWRVLFQKSNGAALELPYTDLTYSDQRLVEHQDRPERRTWHNVATGKAALGNILSFSRGSVRLNWFRQGEITWPTNELSPNDLEYLRRLVGIDYFEEHKTRQRTRATN